MAAIEPGSSRILAVILGAGWYARAPKLAQGKAFEKSAQDFRGYLMRPTGLGLPRANISWLFGDGRSAVDQLREVGDFLERRSHELKSAGTAATDLLLYYCGHGLFGGLGHTYHLAIGATEESREGLTSIRVSDLAQTVNDRGRFLRKFLILDCCFAAAAYREFQSGPLQASRTQLLNEMPTRGTALLCAASAKDAAIAPEGLPRTMFSDSLLKSLETGHPSLGTHMSLSDLGALVRQHLKESFPDSWVRPELHSPDQREGEIADMPLFPNPARGYGPVPARSPQRPVAADGAEPAAAEARRRAEAARLERARNESQLRAQEIERAEAHKAEEERLARAQQERERWARQVAATADHPAIGQGLSGALQRRRVWLIGAAIAAILLYTLVVRNISPSGSSGASSHAQIAPSSSGTPGSGSLDAGATISVVPAASRILPSAKADVVDDSSSSSAPADFGEVQSREHQGRIEPSESINKIKK